MVDGFEGTSDTNRELTYPPNAFVLETVAFRPDQLESYWELGDPEYCEGFNYKY